ncbi:MAG: hypothetical protein J6J86_04855 [Lachnospiraceae bacterium]|nr:hypothetical protein [Lachnospiraceae bacterium]
MYRGKYVFDGEWVEGFLCIDDKISYMEGRENIIRRIDVRTLGRCTGKRDCDEKLIWQGDVLENEAGTRFEVRYGEYTMYCPVDDCMMENVGFFTVADGIYEDMPLGPTEKYAKVIGNIHDNPELKVDAKYRCMACVE